MISDYARKAQHKGTLFTDDTSPNLKTLNVKQLKRNPSPLTEVRFASPADVATNSVIENGDKVTTRKYFELLKGDLTILSGIPGSGLDSLLPPLQRSKLNDLDSAMMGSLGSLTATTLKSGGGRGPKQVTS